MVLVIPCLMNEWREGKGLSLPILELLYSPSEVGFRIRRWIRRGVGGRKFLVALSFFLLSLNFLYRA
uniref:Uncharacterized protein n=1 Tax=Picea glauca TaxID=3330 RepID=A0A101M0E8_PICGL|nr:hypothetical protein ABT39_MTgene4739 [Picea glauca]